MNLKAISSILAGAVFACGLLVNPVVAEEQGLRVAVVRIQEAFNQYQRTKDMRKSIEDAFKPQREAVENLQKEIEQLKAQLRKDSPRLEPNSYKMYERVEAIKKKEYLYKEMRDNFRKDMNAEMVEFYKAVYADFQTAVELYAKQANIDLVIRAADTELKNKDAFGIQNEIGLKILHYYRPALDITPQIVQVMDRTYKMKKTR